MKKTMKWLPVAAAVALLAACGGGGDERPVDKYLGNWVSSCDTVYLAGANPAYPNGLSEIEEATIVAAGDSAYRLTNTSETSYQSADCSGAGTKTAYTTNALLTIVGQFTVAGDVADKVLGTEPGEDDNQVLTLVKDGRIYFGDESLNAPTDAEGYPTTIDFSSWWQKQ